MYSGRCMKTAILQRCHLCGCEAFRDIHIYIYIYIYLLYITIVLFSFFFCVSFPRRLVMSHIFSSALLSSFWTAVISGWSFFYLMCSSPSFVSFSCCCCCKKRMYLLSSTCFFVAYNAKYLHFGIFGVTYDFPNWHPLRWHIPLKKYVETHALSLQDIYIYIFTWEGGDESEDRDTGKGRNPVTTTIQHNTTMSPLYMVLSSSFSWLTWFAPEPSCDHNDTTTLHLYMVLSSSLSATKKQQKGSNNNNNNKKKNKKTMTPSTPLGSFNLKTLLQSTRCWSRTPPPRTTHPQTGPL